MTATLAAQTDLAVIPFDPPIVEESGQDAGSAGMIVGTNFEKKYIAEGRTFNATAAIKPK